MLSAPFCSAARQDGSLRLFMCCFDPTFEAASAQIMKHLKALSSVDLHFYGYGGPQMLEEGLLPASRPMDPNTSNASNAWKEIQVAEYISRLPVMGRKQRGGRTANVPSMYAYIQNLTTAVTACLTYPQPDAVVVLGSRFFSTQFWGAVKTAITSHKLTAPYRIQVGATPVGQWPRSGSPRSWRQIYPVDTFFCEFPSEAAILDAHGMSSHFCGCPWTSAAHEQAAKAAVAQADVSRSQLLAGTPDAPLLYVAPAANDRALEYSLPFYDAVIRRISSTHGPVQLALSVPEMYAHDVVDAVKNFGAGAKVVNRTEAHAVAAACDLALVSNQQDLIACAMVGTPVVATYLHNPLGRLLQRLWPGKQEPLAACNFAPKSLLVPEVAVWGSPSVGTVADTVVQLLQDSQARQHQVQGLKEWLTTLAPPQPWLGMQPTEAIAARMLQLLEQHHSAVAMREH